MSYERPASSERASLVPSERLISSHRSLRQLGAGRKVSRIEMRPRVGLEG
jgi:hypothetical protein